MKDKVQQALKVANNIGISQSWVHHKVVPNILICDESHIYHITKMKLLTRYNSAADGNYSQVKVECDAIVPKDMIYNVHELMGLQYCRERVGTEVFDHIDENKQNNHRTNITVKSKAANNVTATFKGREFTYEEYEMIMNLYSWGETSQNALQGLVLARMGLATDVTRYTRMVKGESYKGYHARLREEEPGIVQRIDGVLKRKGKK